MSLEEINETPSPESGESKIVVPEVSRRNFLTSVAGVTAGTLLGSGLGPKAFGPFIARAQTPGKQKLNVMFVGTGGQPAAHVKNLLDTFKENCIAYCDADTSRMGAARERAPQAPSYTDWRQMFEKHLDKADAVIVGTPDHTHALPSLHAILAGKAVYCEKPLTWSIEEARLMAQATALKKVATQMGNQGHASESIRLVVEWLRGGVIGDVTEVHTWTNRPVWPQGNLQVEPVPKPDSLNWDAWLGPAMMRPYHKHSHDFNWRGWFDYGCGAVGDMGTHTWDAVYWALQPDYPLSVELLAIEGRGEHTYAQKTHFKWSFPAKGTRPAFEAHWYSKGWKPPVPDELKNDPDRPADKRGLPDSGSLYVGTKGKLLVAGDYSDSPRLIPEKFMREALRPEKRPAKSIPRSPGHMAEFVRAAKGEAAWDSPGSAFSTYAGPITEVMLLGAISEKIGEVGYKFQCDPVNREILSPRVEPYRSRGQYRKGFELPRIA